MIMNPYLLPIFALLIVGCGNRMQPSSDEILDDITQNSNGETENLDSIRVLVRCKEKAKLFFDKEEYTHRALDTSYIYQCYENKYEPHQWTSIQYLGGLALSSFGSSYPQVLRLV